MPEISSLNFLIYDTYMHKYSIYFAISITEDFAYSLRGSSFNTPCYYESIVS